MREKLNKSEPHLFILKEKEKKTSFTKEELKEYMTADVARNGSIIPRLQKIMNEVKSKAEDGYINASIYGSLYPEVSEALTTSGYDIEIYPETNQNDFGEIMIFGDKAEPDKKGTVTIRNK